MSLPEKLRDWQDYRPALEFCPLLVVDAVEAADEIERLCKAVWDYGEHTFGCTVRDGKECNCGFFELLKTVPVPTAEQTQTPETIG